MLEAESGYGSGLIDHEAHGDCPLRHSRDGENILQSQDLGSIGQGSADVLWLQPGVFAQDLALGDSLGQHAHDELDRYARSADDRLARHHLGIDANSLVTLLIHYVSTPLNVHIP